MRSKTAQRIFGMASGDGAPKDVIAFWAGHWQTQDTNCWGYAVSFAIGAALAKLGIQIMSQTCEGIWTLYAPRADLGLREEAVVPGPQMGHQLSLSHEPLSNNH